ncbi:MAG: universal stress protein [Candidatus Amulumruptor caecigallinarius]|nr:universal stress protein [Candidatus Amulumruptor caecigallinarius]
MGIPSEENMVTLVVHTPSYAARIKEVLGSHRIVAVLEDLDVRIDGEYPQKVRIAEKDLSTALKIIESGDNFVSSEDVMKLTGMSKTLLIPVDFSSHGDVAVNVGFALAQLFGVEPVLLHAYLAPIFPSQPPYSDFTDQADDIEGVEEMVEINDMRRQATAMMSRFKNKLIALQKNGTLPDIKFSTRLIEGVAEEVILQYCKMNQPVMVVMATRGKSKKEEQLVGSVTAEVIDSCRIPVFAVPDNYEMSGIAGMKRILMFCNMSAHDVLTVRTLMKIFNYPACEVFLVPVSERFQSASEHKIEALRNYLADMYPTAVFHVHKFSRESFDNDLNALVSEQGIQMLIVPNKKSNAFSRLFKPTIAHKCLFERDIPMIAVPV